MKAFSFLSTLIIFCLLPLTGVWAQGQGNGSCHVTPIIEGQFDGGCPDGTNYFATAKIGIRNNTDSCQSDPMYLGVYDTGSFFPVAGNISGSYLLGVQALQWSDFKYQRGTNPATEYAYINEAGMSITIPSEYCGDNTDNFSIDMAFILLASTGLNTYQAYEEVLPQDCFDYLFLRSQPCLGDGGGGGSEMHFLIDELSNTYGGCCAADPDPEHFQGTNNQLTTISPDHQKINIQNPFDDQLNFSLKTTTGELKLRLFDLQGRIYWQQNQHVDQHSINVSIDASQFPAGMYFLNTQQQGESSSYRLVKQK